MVEVKIEIELFTGRKIMIYKIRMYLHMAIVGIGVWCLAIIGRRVTIRRIEHLNERRAVAATVALFAFIAIGLAWWVIDQDSTSPFKCHLTSAWRLRTDRPAEQVMECL
jgi:hypothetical protein